MARSASGFTATNVYRGAKTGSHLEPLSSTVKRELVSGVGRRPVIYSLN